MSEAKECFAKIVEATTSSSGVTLGASKKGFGSFALCAGGKIFAMISTRDEFVVKLPRARVDALVASGVGVRFDPAHGRMMKEWRISCIHQGLASLRERSHEVCGGEEPVKREANRTLIFDIGNKN